MSEFKRLRMWSIFREAGHSGCLSRSAINELNGYYKNEL